MPTQQTKQGEDWRCRREQYLRDSGRHAELIKEGYASTDSTTEWTVVVGGRGRGPLEPGTRTRLSLVGRQVLTLAFGAKGALGQPEESAPQKRSGRGGR